MSIPKNQPSRLKQIKVNIAQYSHFIPLKYSTTSPVNITSQSVNNTYSSSILYFFKTWGISIFRKAPAPILKALSGFRDSYY